MVKYNCKGHHEGTCVIRQRQGSLCKSLRAFAYVGLKQGGGPHGWPAFWDACAAHHMMGLASGCGTQGV